MGQCKSKKIHLSLGNSETNPPNQILAFLWPKIRVCRFFGAFPCDRVVSPVSGLSQLKVNRGWWFVYSLLIWLLTSTYMGFQLGSLLISVGMGHSVIKLIAQSLWLNAGLLPYAVSIFMFLFQEKVVGIFEAWGKIEIELQALFCYMKTKKHIRNFTRTYLILAAVSTTMCGFHVIMEPRNPTYPMHYLYSTENFEKKNNTTSGNEAPIPAFVVYGYGVIQVIIMMWKWAGFAVMEGLCCLFATVFIQCMESVMEGLDFVLHQMKGSHDDETLEQVLKSVLDDPSVISEPGTIKINPSKSKSATHQNNNYNYKGSTTGKGKLVASSMKQEEYVMFAIKNLQAFSSLQAYINSVIGPLLLLDFGQLVLMTCALTFLPIVSSKTVNIVGMIVFGGNWITIIARLVLLIMCLGNVYTKGQDVNVGLAKAMNSCCLSPAVQSSVLAHLTVCSSNPVSFTAWGFFPITRGTLLAAFSLISTYAVVFLQMNV